MTLSADDASGGAERRVAQDSRVAVIDMGSNTVRMVVFDGNQRVPFLMFNEKSVCGLGRELSTTGRLHPDGVDSARRLLTRFARLVRQMAPDRLHLLATAAMREAEDGPEFATWVEQLFGQKVELLSGPDEARLAALGVLCGTPQADGLVADLGGGSLDLLGVEHGQLGGFAETTPYGHIKIGEAMGGNDRDLVARMRDHMGSLPGMAPMGGRTLYAVGGSWRALASLFINLVDYPLHVIDHFSLHRDRALELIETSVLSRKARRRKMFVSMRRAKSLPAAGLVLKALLEASECREVVFSGYGLREGRFFESLSDDQRDHDPILAGCRGFIALRSRFGPHDQELHDWLTPVFAVETERQRQLRRAICVLGDIAWREHPDYRAQHAFLRVLRMPLPGLNHGERVEMALATACRYNHGRNLPDLKTYLPLIDEPTRHRAMAIGAGLRLAHILSGGAPGVLDESRLEPEGDALKLALPPGGALYRSETVEKRLANLAQAAGFRSSKVV